MNRHAHVLAGGVLMLGMTFSGRAAAQQARPVVSVRLAHAVSVPAEVIAGARAEVSRIYGVIGVQVIWTEHAPEDGGRHFVVAIVSKHMSTWLKAGPAALAIAFVADNVAYVMIERVERFARTSRTWGHSVSITLGLTIAHEIGHLLLKSTAHAVAGLMSAVWSLADAQRAASGNLLFTPREAELIRKGLEGRR